MGGFFGGGGGGGGGGSVYAASFEKFWFAGSGGYNNQTDGLLATIHTSPDVIYDSALGTPMWRLAPGVYLCNVHIVYLAAGGTGGLVGGICQSYIDCAVSRGTGLNTAYRFLYQTIPIPANHQQSRYGMSITALINSTDQATQGLSLSSEWNWGNTTLSQGLDGFIEFQKVSSDLFLLT